MTFGFWKKGLIPQNKNKVARQMGCIAEEKFMTAENIAYLVPKISDLFLSKNAEGKICGVEFVRRLAVRHKDEVAKLLRRIGLSFLAGDSYKTIQDISAKVGRSEAVSNALSAALLDYMEKNPDAVATFVKEMVKGLLTKNETPCQEKRTTVGFLDLGWGSLFEKAKEAIFKFIGEIGYPQIRKFLEEYAKSPNLLCLTSDGVEEDSDLDDGGDAGKVAWFRSVMAQRIMKHVGHGSWPVLIHCTEGVSRSGNVASVLDRYWSFFWDTKPEHHEHFKRVNQNIDRNPVIGDIFTEYIETGYMGEP